MNGILTRSLLAILAAAAGLIALRPYLAPAAAHAQAAAPYPFYIEPGTQMLRDPSGSRQVFGRVVVDMTTGNIWGFPTIGTDTYPFSGFETRPQVSHPFYLGRFAFEEVKNAAH